jgi:hypothetical protein
MATEKQIAASRRDAQHSTGPRTPEGKAAVPGLFSRHLVLTGVEDPAALQAILDGLNGDFQPQTADPAVVAEPAHCPDGVRAVAQSQTGEAWQKFRGNQPLPGQPRSGRNLDRRRVRQPDPGLARSRRLLRREMPRQQKCENEPISGAEPEPPGSKLPAPAPEIAKTEPIFQESSPAPRPTAEGVPRDQAHHAPGSLIAAAEAWKGS